MITIKFFLSLNVCFLLFLAIIPATEVSVLKKTSFLASIWLFIFSLIFWLKFNPLLGFQFTEQMSFFSFFSLHYGIDCISLFLVILTTFIFSLSFLTLFFSLKKNVKTFILLFFFLEFLLLNSFLILDFLGFYIFFEVSLIPMFLLIGIWGSQLRKMKAAYYLFIYTIVGSLFMFLVIAFLFVTFGTTEYFVLLTHILPINYQLVLWPAIFFGFAIKVPMFPFHLWLPEAHVEAPTSVSVLLAAIVLKLGGYGMLRFLIPLLPQATVYYAPFALVLAIIGSIYAALTALRQLDLKRIIAYSSIAHMNVALLGLFSLTSEGILGFYYVMLGHGFISSGLFFIVGVLYDRYHSRLYYYYSGLSIRMPLFASFFFLFTIANTAFPGTINFVGELLILSGIVKISLGTFLFAGISIFFSTIYSFWLYNRINFGTINILQIKYYYDLTKHETYVLGLLLILIIIAGIFPQFFINIFQVSLLNYLN